MEMAIRMVFEAVALGLLFKIKKCVFFPRRLIKTLGTIVNLTEFTLAVSVSRAAKIRRAMSDLRETVRANWESVPARKIASFIGLVWSIAPCCHRAAGIMLRSITAVLTSGMRATMTDVPKGHHEQILV